MPRVGGGDATGGVGGGVVDVPPGVTEGVVGVTVGGREHFSGSIGMIWEDLGLLSEKNNCHQEEIDNVSSEWKTLFKIIGHLETIIDTQKHNITRLKRNVTTLDQNACCCCNHLLSPEPHSLSDEDGLEYSTDL